MSNSLRIVLGLIFLTIGIVSAPVISGQEPTASPMSSPVAATAEKVKNAATSDPKTPEPAADDFWHRETATGDWGGTRSQWKEKGVELEFKLSNFYQGIASGGTDKHAEYNGKFEMTWKYDLGKIAGWKWWTAEFKAESRFGGPVLEGTGGVNPVNTGAFTPGIDGSVTSITAVNFTRLIPKDLKKGDLYAFSFGRFNMLDLLSEDFFGGGGTDRFLNIADIGPLTVLRQVPLVTNGASFAYIKGGEPYITFAVIDPNDHSLNAGLKDLFADGVTFTPGINFTTKYGGKSGKHSFGGAVTTKKYTPFDQTRQIILPGPPRVPLERKRGSWSINYAFRQYFVERAPHDGWGFFTQLAIADRQRSPVTRFVNVGLGGNGLFSARRTDEFGIAYAYTGLSRDLIDNVDLITIGRRTLQPEHQVETFYNFHITPWLQLTGDLQFIRGVRPSIERAIVPGGRLVMIF